MKIVIPLRDGEKHIAKYANAIYICSKDCIEPFGYEYFAEIGKYFTFIRSSIFEDAMLNNEDIALIQNTKIFNNIERLHIDNEDDVILCKAQHFQSLERQFKEGHGDLAPIFDEAMKIMNAPRELVTMDRCCFHNMMIAKPKLIVDYLNDLMEILMKLFKPEYNKKVGAYLSERILNLWCLMQNKHIIEHDFTFLKK